jgi:serine/threonine protein kinase
MATGADDPESTQSRDDATVTRDGAATTIARSSDVDETIVRDAAATTIARSSDMDATVVRDPARPNDTQPLTGPTSSTLARTGQTAQTGPTTPTAGATRTTELLPEIVQSGPDRDLRIGSVVNERFVIEGVLGRGGMGVVYRARDLRKEETGDRDPHVALKVLSDEFRRDPRMVIALQRESRKAQTLAHPNIATVFDFDRDGNIVYLTMEELDGRPLNSLIRENPRGLAQAEALEIIRGLSSGLAYAHDKNIVHSDFKPGNAFFTHARAVKILDFGIARAAPMGRTEASEETRFDPSMLGALTPSYAACEMFEGQDPHPADDVYALAIVAYQLLSGRHPFGSKPAPQARAEKLVPAPIKGLKRRQWRAIAHGLAFERADRSQSATDFLRELEGSNRLKIIASATVVISLLFAGYAGYTEFRERARALPDIPFEALSEEKRAMIQEALRDGVQLERFGDDGNALILYRDAYRLHPRNPEVVAKLEALMTDLVEEAIKRGRADELRRVGENLRELMAIDDFLAKHPALLEAAQDLSNAERARSGGT